MKYLQLPQVYFKQHREAAVSVSSDYPNAGGQTAPRDRDPILTIDRLVYSLQDIWHTKPSVLASNGGFPK